MRSSCCIICYKNCEESFPLSEFDSNKISFGGDDDDKRFTKKEEVLRRLLQLLGRHLKTMIGNGNQEKTKIKRSYEMQDQCSVNPFEEIISAGLSVCEDCLNLLQAFGDLLHQMKTIELHINWKLWKLKNIMAAAAKVPSRVEHFKTAVGNSQFLEKTGSSLKHVVKLRKDLIKKCNNLLLTSFPKLSLHKYVIPKTEIPQKNNSQASSTTTTEEAKEGHTNKNTTRSGFNKLRRTFQNFNPPRKRGMYHKYILNKIKGARRTISSKRPANFALQPTNLAKLKKFDVIKTEVGMTTKQSLTCDDNEKKSFVKQENHILEYSLSDAPIVPQQDAAAAAVSRISTIPDETVILENFSIVRKLRAVHKCNVCGKTFSSEKSLLNHKKMEECTSILNEEAKRDLRDEEKSINESIHHDVCNQSESETSSAIDSGSTTGTSDEDEDDDDDDGNTVTLSVSKCVSPPQKTVSVKRKRGRMPKVRDCAKCDLSFIGQMQLITHKRVAHKKIKKERQRLKKWKNRMHRFLCPHCNDKSFRHLHDLLLHIKDTCSVFITGESIKEESANAAAAVGNLFTIKLLSSSAAYMPAPLCCSVKQLKDVKEVSTLKVSTSLIICPVSNCSRPFYSQQQLDLHTRLHGSNFKCNFCEFVKDYAPDLAEHVLEKHSSASSKNTTSTESTYTFCTQCNFKCVNKPLYIDHFLQAHLSLLPSPVMEFSCGICKGIKDYKGRQELIRHYKASHTLSNGEADILNCGVESCTAYFLTQNQLGHHLNRDHSHLDTNSMLIARGLKCIDCDKSFFSKNSLQIHRLKHHVEEDKKIYCSIRKCIRMFETKNELENHIKNSHKQEMVDCSKCNQSFATVKDLKSHEKIHRDNKKVNDRGQNFICELCGKRFKYKDKLFRHKLCHAGPASWEWICSVCSKKCMTKQKLDEHQRTHTKEKPFVCEVCGVKYAHRHNLRIHHNSKHGDVIQDMPRKFDKTNLTSKKGVKRNRKSPKSSFKTSGSETDCQTSSQPLLTH